MGPPGWRRRGEGAGRYALAAALALVGHLVFAVILLFLSLIHLGGTPERKKLANPRPVTLRPLSANQWAKNRGDPRASDDSRLASKAREDNPKKDDKKAEEIPDGQIVDVAPGNGEKDPNAKYLAESSNKTEKETKAKDQTAFYRNAMPKRTSTTPQDGSGTAAVDKPQIAGNNGIGNDDRPLLDQSEKKAVVEIPDVKKREEIAMKVTPGPGPGARVDNRTESEAVVGNSNRLKLQQGGALGEEDASQGRKGTPGVVSLVPSASVLDKINGAAPNDKLDLEEGEGTFLNTKEWKYSSFFNRVKQSVGMHWDPGRELRQRDPSGQIYGGRDRYTVLAVTLNEKGMVKDVYVEKSCGLDFLDLEAIHSFERAQPFPNPPPGLVQNDAAVHFSFGFFLEMGGGPRLRLFRSNN